MPAGQAPTIYKPAIWVAERNTPLPGINLPFRSAWPVGWEKFQGLPEDATLDFSNPKEGIKTKDLGELDRLPTGDDAIGLKMSTAVPKATDLTRAYNLVRSAVAARAEVATLEVTAGNTGASAEDVTVNLDTGDGTLTAFTVSIAAGASATAAATTIRGTAYTGYTTGGSGTTVTFTANTAGDRVDATFVGSTNVAGTMTTAQNHPAFEHMYFDPHAETNFMIGLEGYEKAGGFFDNERFVRVFIYNVEQAEEGGRGGGGGGRRGGGGGGGGRGGNASGEPGQMKFGWSNEGAVVVAYDIKAFTEPGRDTLVTGTGYANAPQLDPQARLDMFHIEIPPQA